MAQKTLERPKVLEGTWEEVTKQAGDLAGKRVTLTIHSEPAEDTARENGNEPKNLLEFLGDYVGGVHGGGKARSRDTGKAFTEHLAEKRRQGHL